MEVELVVEFEGTNPLWYLARGHVQVLDFLARVSEEFEECYGPEDVEHGYARNVPVGRDRLGETLVYLAEGPGRGAYPITYIDLMLVGVSYSLAKSGSA